ncbi:MAG TPA: hypothetical protein VHB21_27695, partial [Minicystis sp.]|nr:hypothetical protein [Minicystis sp.]
MATPPWLRSRVALAAALSLAQSGCFLAKRSVVVRLRDPADVAVVAGDGSEREVLPADDAPRAAVLSSGTFAAEGSARATYELDVDRRPDRGLDVRVQKPAILGGELLPLLPPNGRIEVPGTADAGRVV